MERMIYALILSIACLLTSSSQEKNPYIREGSIGKKVTTEPKITSKGSFPYRSINEWVGERFIFLPVSKKLQEYGYQGIDGGDGRYNHPSYKSYVGRIMKVTSVEKEYPLYRVTFQMEDSKETLRATAYSETVDGIAPLADIDSARAKWLGRTLWYKGNQLVSYDENKDSFEHVDLKKFSPLKVVDVVAGWYSNSPVRLILQDAKGNEGYEDLNVSNTNVPDILQPHNKFEDKFFETDPRQTYKWSPKVWQAIEDGKVFVGMTKEQAILSWGKPKEINRTNTGLTVHEQWVYGDHNYLYFENEKLTSIQN
jgi:hypothetical protein